MGPDRTWWRVKVGCGVGLIASLFFYYLGETPPPQVPRVLSQVLIIKQPPCVNSFEIDAPNANCFSADGDTPLSQ